jgi:GGDEF domain-containing protein
VTDTVSDIDYGFSYFRLGELPDDGVLFCDPLTSLVSYPSFESYLIKMLPLVSADGLHVAIGDVDGLRAYASERRPSDPSSFGHLAGNACMRTIGRQTRAWASAELGDFPFSACGTFGGDEVIVGASGLHHETFASKIRLLCEAIKVASPRPCSFALATIKDGTVTTENAAGAYRTLVSTVDAQLLHEKEHARLTDGHLHGTVTDLGMVSLSGAGNQPLPGPRA